MLGADGIGHAGLFRMVSGAWVVYRPETITMSLGSEPYLVPAMPVDFHRHTVGGIDLSSVETIQLSEVDRVLREESVKGVLTTFLPRAEVRTFCEFARTFHEAKQRGDYTYIAGLALEGPLLSSPGGSPGASVWRPTKTEWQLLATCAEYGLKYIVLSPDFDNHDITSSHELPSIRWITTLLLEAGISPALGHVRKDDPEASAAAIQDVFETAAGIQCSVPLLSDHLFNDMPLRFQHAWRTSGQKSRRERELSNLRVEEWNLGNIEERLGPVPAALIRGARDGRIKICLNFDGEHVDLLVARQVVELVGADNIIALTDRVDGSVLARQQVISSPENRLLYRSDGAVVASSVSLDDQIANMRTVGVCEEDVWKMTSLNPSRLLDIEPNIDEKGRPILGSFVNADRFRGVFDSRDATLVPLS